MLYLKSKKIPDVQQTMDMLYETVDELQEMVNALLEENERLRSRTTKEIEEEQKMCDKMYLDWFKEEYGVTPEEADEEEYI